jgi:hypothetical protein
MTEEVFFGSTIKITAANIVICRDWLARLLKEEKQLRQFLIEDPRRAIFDGDSVFYALDARERIIRFVTMLDERIRVLKLSRHAYVAG